MEPDTAVLLQDLLRKGKYTTEFWLALAAQVLGALAASGVLHPGHWSAQVVGLAIMVLSGLGYSWSRTAIKLEGLRALAYVPETAPKPKPEEPVLSLGDGT